MHNSIMPPNKSRPRAACNTQKIKCNLRKINVTQTKVYEISILMISEKSM